MSNITKLNEDNDDYEIFSPYTHKVLEDFINKVIDANRASLPNKLSQKIVREFFLYGFLRASGQEIAFWNKRDVVKKERVGGLFCVNNGVLALSDFDGEVYIRGADDYHGYYNDYYDDFDRGFMKSGPGGIEDTLITFGYRPGGFFVPHSNGEIFTDEKMEKLFKALRYFSREVRKLRGESTGVIIKDLSEPYVPAPYQARCSYLPRIVVKDIFLIPGNREKTIEF